MAYGLDTELFIENGPAVLAANSARLRPASRFLRWRMLDTKDRLEVVERALEAPANDRIDAYPIAL